MKVLVTAKRVTDPDARIKLNKEKSGIETEGLEYKVNPFDENAIEAGLKLMEKHGGEVVVASIGTEESRTYIRTGLAMGATRGILVLKGDEELDSDLVARVLARIYELEQPDIVIMGKQAIDGDSNQVGQLLAEYLDLPQACFASALEVGEGTVTVTREVDGGLETLELDLPAVITADLRLNEPRYASLPGIMKAKRKEIKELTTEELGVDTALKVETLAYDDPPERQPGIIVESVEELVDKLHNEARVI